MWSLRHHDQESGPPPRPQKHGLGVEHAQDDVSACTPGIRYRELVASSPANSGRTSASSSSLSGSRLVALCLLFSCLTMSDDRHGSAFGLGAEAASSPSSGASSESPFESETLSPRTVNTKYGSLRGLLVSFRTNDAASRYSSMSSSGSRTTSAASTSPPSSSSSPAHPPASPSSSSSVSSAAVTNLRPVEVFLGVPYATPPTGSLRFMPPVTPTHWRGIRLATRFAAVCPQKPPDAGSKATSSSSTTSILNRSSPSAPSRSSSSSSKPTFSFTPNSYASMASLSSSSSSASFPSSNQLPESRISHLKRMSAFLRNQSEDCLYLNVYAPFPSSSQSSSSSQQPARKAQLPVMVFIHGESYDWGTGNSFDATTLSSVGNVVIVTLNYRVGLFGFLPASLDGNGLRGNYGLMDQVAALHWIQENIAEFGGDPGNVTLTGHGFGAACVNLLMISPMASSSLFTRVILIKGSALSPWAIARDADFYSRQLAKSLSCPVHDNALLVDCLRSKSMDELLAVDLKAPDQLTAFGPIIDGIVIPSEPRSLVPDFLDDDHQQQVYYLKHHMLPDHENMKSYDGVVRQISFHFNSFPTSPNNTTRIRASQIDAKAAEAKQASASPPRRLGSDAAASSTPSSSSSSLFLGSPSHRPPNASANGNRSTQATPMSPMVMEQGPIVTALSLTIAVGCGLLIVNVLIFVGVYYQVNRGKKEKPASISDQGNACNQSEYDGTRAADSSGGGSDQKLTSETSGTLVRAQHQNTHRHQHSPRQLNQYQFQEPAGFHLQALPLTQEEVIILAQKENIVSSDPYGQLDKSSSRIGVGADDGLMLPTDLDLYSSHQTHSLAGHHHHHHHHNHHNPDLHNNRCHNGGGMNLTTSSSSSASPGTSSHHHVHFLHPHLSQVQILDSSDGLLDPPIVTSACHTSSTLSRSSYIRS